VCNKVSVQCSVSTLQLELQNVCNILNVKCVWIMLENTITECTLYTESNVESYESVAANVVQSLQDCNGQSNHKWINVFENVCVDFIPFVVIPIIFFTFVLILVLICVCVRQNQLTQARRRQAQYQTVNLQPLPAAGEYVIWQIMCTSNTSV